MSQQPEWRFCQNCYTMFYNGVTSKGVCLTSHQGPDGFVLNGGEHQAQGFNFDLYYDLPETATAQANWRYCSKCGVMYYDGAADKGQCSAGGAHQANGYGYTFTLPHDVAENGNAQGAWRACQKCQSLFFDGYADKGRCPGNRSLSLVVGPHQLIGGHVAGGFNYILPHDLQAQPDVGTPQVSIVGDVWVVSLTHEQAEFVEGLLGTIAGAIIKAGPKAFPADVVAAAIGGAAGIILMVDAIGGDQGVDVQGVVGVNGVIVTPHLSGMFQTLVEGARKGVAAASIAGYLVGSASQVPVVATQLGIATAADIFTRVSTGMPLGWALAGALGAVINLLLPAPDPNDHGGVHADRPRVGDWERFTMPQAPPGNRVALLSWLGFFSAQGGGGGDVYANRSSVNTWEAWTLIDNHDNTFSFQAPSGHYLTALNGGGGGSFCKVTATGIGPNERFFIQNLAGGQVALKTAKGTFVSVQPGK